MLSLHSQIAGVVDEKHTGIRESFYFSHTCGRYGDLGTKSNYVEFVEVMAASYYFQQAGVTKEFLYSLWPMMYEEIFRKVMDRFAQAKGANFWVEKSPPHTLCVNRIATAYPDAKFVAVWRDAEKVMEPTVARRKRCDQEYAANPRVRRRGIVRSVLNWAYHYKVIEQFAARSDRILIVRHDDMKADIEGVMRKVCSFMGVDFEPSMIDVQYIRNTAFRNREERKGALSDGERKLIRRWVHLSKVMPRWVLACVWRRIRHRDGRQTLPPWFFALVPFVKADDSLRPKFDPSEE